MEINEYAAGTPCWIDLGCDDIGRAASFYSALFGWNVSEPIPEAGGYRLASLRDRQVAGLGPQMNPGPPFWATYIRTDDTEETLDKVREAGGTVVMDTTEVMDQGIMGIFHDNQGAVCSLWQPMAHRGSGLANEHGSLTWNELSARDVDAAMAFYPAVFGWIADVKDDGEMPYTEWQLDGRTIAGMAGMMPEVPESAHPHWSVCFAVDDCDDAVAKVSELGGSIQTSPTDIPPGRFAVVRDDQGAEFAVMKLAL